MLFFLKELRRLQEFLTETARRLHGECADPKLQSTPSCLHHWGPVTKRRNHCSAALPHRSPSRSAQLRSSAADLRTCVSLY